MKKNNKKGFTLIELLAVIVILAILATAAFTLVIPRINEARYDSFATEGSAFLDAAGTYFVRNTDKKQVSIKDLLNGYASVKGNSASYKGCVFKDPKTSKLSIYYTNGSYSLTKTKGSASAVDESAIATKNANNSDGTGYSYIYSSSAGISDCQTN